MMKTSFNRKYHGITLIELLVAVAAAAILVRIGYVSYTSYQIRHNRELAKHALIQAAAAMEKYYAQNGRYTTEKNKWPNGLFADKVYGSSGLVYKYKNGNWKSWCAGF